jgi:hypothetical protein
VKSAPKTGSKAADSGRTVDKPAFVSTVTKDWLRNGSGQGQLVPAQGGRELLCVVE